MLKAQCAYPASIVGEMLDQKSCVLDAALCR